MNYKYIISKKIKYIISNKELYSWCSPEEIGNMAQETEG